MANQVSSKNRREGLLQDTVNTRNKIEMVPEQIIAQDFIN